MFCSSKPNICGRLLRCELLSLEARLRQVLSMLRVGVGVRFVAVRLSGLREQDERRRIGGLQAEGEVEQNERIEVEAA